MTDAAIHRVSGDAGGFVCSGNEGQWIATGFALAMTRWRVRVGWWVTVDRHGLRPRDDKGELMEIAVRLLVHSGSPRASPSR